MTTAITPDHRPPERRKRPLIAFFDYADVFEDFYLHYGVSQKLFGTEWNNSGNHAFLALLQREVGDVIWYSFSLRPELSEAEHRGTGCKIKMLSSSWLHRKLWSAFYLPRCAWRWRGLYPAYATLASYLAPLSAGLVRTLRQDRPDFFFVQDYSSGKFDVLMMLSKLFRAPLVAYHSGSEADKYIGTAIRRLTLPRAHRVLASSGPELEMLADRYQVPRERLKVVLTPIEMTGHEPPDRSTACRETGLDPHRRYLLFVGRLDDKVKRVSSIIRAFGMIADKYPDADLLIAGDGTDRKELETAASLVSATRIKFLGWLSSTETKACLYTAAECLVLASSREGFPTVIGEAMACGTPVVSSQVGAVPELVVDGVTGWLFPSGDDAALARALDSALAQTPAAAASMRDQARLMAQRRVSPAAISTILQDCFRV